MNNKLSLTFTSIIILLLSACGMAIIPGSGRITNETREVQGYSQIVFSAPGELTIDQNGHEGLAIEADDNLLPYLHTRVQGDVLYIYMEEVLVKSADLEIGGSGKLAMTDDSCENNRLR